MTCNRAAILSSASLTHSGPSRTPPAPAHLSTRRRHGATVIDNYFWLRDKSNPAVIEYLKSEMPTPMALTKI